MNPFGRPRLKQLDSLGNGNSPRQGEQQVDVISSAANCQRGNSILPSDAADIAMKPFLDVIPDRRTTLCGRKYYMNQTTCVTVRHGFRRSLKLGFLFECTQDCILGYSQPSLRDCSLAHANPGLHPGLLSAVPTGLNFES
jgi:hypothetical protein